MQTKDIREKILNFMREESYAPMTSEELVDALGHDVNCLLYTSDAADEL
mgnify:CR=1 FL=1